MGNASCHSRALLFTFLYCRVCLSCLFLWDDLTMTLNDHPGILLTTVIFHNSPDIFLQKKWCVPFPPAACLSLLRICCVGLSSKPHCHQLQFYWTQFQKIITAGPVGYFYLLIAGRKQRPMNSPWVSRHPSQPVICNFSLVTCGLGGGDGGCRWGRMRGQGSIYAALGKPPALLCGYFKVICAPAYNHLPVTL